MSNSIVGVQSYRDIPREAGVITPAVVDELKEDMKSDLAEDLIDLLEVLELIKWSIDGAERKITASVNVKISKDK